MITHDRDLIGNDRRSRSDTPNSGVVLLDCTKFVLEFVIHFQQLLSEMPQSFQLEQNLNVSLL